MAAEGRGWASRRTWAKYQRDCGLWLLLAVIVLGAMVVLHGLRPGLAFELTSLPQHHPRLGQARGKQGTPELDIYWTIVVEDGHLVTRRRKYVDSKLTPLFADAFSDDWEPLMG